ncbi:tetratricopeptide repeat protein [Streptobacillus moniliformis]|uniref:Tetratricopeptide domain protein n=1 Tax=Streptobacillus moniliformis (strain ATCC 14647 / DSM 12112 / NCTC 10651 / 9901) TaxID=519441 RepID=D1AVD0_STRM9|nr:hypothetical protein [Streptobacillus moniliformis]ACZ01690.1 hypothetical protein Smon_1236 [Streptobacillus moniliformis DSM 12112]AVL43311.1 hypothetical protein CEP89_05570 [Streptobacillus moniliformis]QXW66364.1 hypothetical protein KX935_03975 [Streptobacillus moniliformis]SQA13131.1 Uncharacterized enzyme of heme biosynthesis [Streptobacillus moniliformis]
MKKKLLILATLLIATINFAGTKEDFEKAYKNYETTKNVEQLEKDLLEIVKAKTDHYTISSKFDLAKIKIMQKKNDEARKYINEILADKLVSADGIKIAKTLLYSIEENYDKKMKILSELISSDPKDLSLQVEMLKELSVKKDNVKFDRLYKEYVKKIAKDDKLKTSFDINLIKDLLAQKQFSNADKIIKPYFTSKNNELKALANYYTAISKFEQKDIKSSIKYSDMASKLSKELDADIENFAYLLAIENKENDKALKKLIILKNLTKDKSVYFELISLAEVLNKKELVESTTKEFRATLDEKQNMYLNDTLSKLFLSDKMYELAEKYAKKTLTEDKNPEGHLVLAVIYANLNKKEEALKNVREAVSKKVEGAAEIEKQILENLK